MSSPPNNDNINNSVIEEIDIKEIENKCDNFIKEIMASPDEYTTKKNLEEYQISLKEDLMKLLKKNDVFPVKLGTYQRGFSSKMDANTRLIVSEKDDATKCREYSSYRIYDQFCLQCRSSSKHKHKVLIYSRYIHGILFVPVKHICAPKEFAAVMEVQEKLKDGDLKAALSLQRKYAVKKHPRYLLPKEKPRKRSKPLATEKSDKPTKAPKKKKDAVVVDGNSAIKVADGDNNIDLHLNETIAKDANDVVDPSAIGNHLLYKSIDDSSSPTAAIPDGNEKSDGSLQPEDHDDKASTSKIAALSGMEIAETVEDSTVNDNNDTLKPEATSASSSTDSQTLSSPLNPSEASSSTDARRGGRKRGSKNLLFAKNSLDLIDAIKSLLPPQQSFEQQSFDENSAPKRRRRRRKASIQAAALEATKTERRRRRKASIQAAAAKTEVDENMDLIASSNATESILDMIDTELLNNEKYLSENSSTSDDNENTDDCEIIEENLFISLQNEHQIRNMRERTETITIEDEE
uniref:Uncharacterized protein n=1 Tax=Panagrolaimus sp. PS1159 TaxID=55785 RepID=A0AC35GDN6_9BILA